MATSKNETEMSIKMVEQERKMRVAVEAQLNEKVTFYANKSIELQTKLGAEISKNVDNSIKVIELKQKLLDAGVITDV